MNGAPTTAQSESLKVGDSAEIMTLSLPLALPAVTSPLSMVLAPAARADDPADRPTDRHPGLIGRVVKCAFLRGGEIHCYC